MRKIENQVLPATDVIELEAFGLTNSLDRARPVLLFREKKGEAILPVWLSPLDAGISLTQHNTQTEAISPHDISLQALAVLGVAPESCHFSELKGHHQYVEIRFHGSRKLKVLRTRADFAMSFCLQGKVRFFCTRGYLQRCRDVEVELTQTQATLKGKRDSGRPGRMYLN